MNEGRKAAQGSPRKRTTRNTLPITRDHAFPLIIPLAQSSAQPQSVQVAVAFRAQLAAQPTTHTESSLSVHSHHCASSLLAKPHPSLRSTRALRPTRSASCAFVFFGLLLSRAVTWPLLLAASRTCVSRAQSPTVSVRARIRLPVTSQCHRRRGQM